MITLSRLNGAAFAVNCDLIERIDASPDTVLTLVDGTRYVVSESMDEVIERVRAFRAEIVALSHGIQSSNVRNLRVVATDVEEH
jgi:flagellar protein FlbD